MSQPAQRFPVSAQFLHWLMAALMIGLWIAGQVIEELPKGDFRSGFIGVHKSLGVVVLLLAVVRVGLRFTYTAPAAPDTMKPWEVISAKLGHLGLYGLMFALPVDGILMSQTGGRDVAVFGLKLPTLIGKDEALNHLFKEGHEALAFGLLLLVAVHAGAALRHHFLLKDGVLRRMLPGA